MGSDLRFGGFRVSGRLNRAAAASRGRQGREVAGDGQGQVLLGGSRAVLEPVQTSDKGALDCRCMWAYRPDDESDIFRHSQAQHINAVT